MFHRRAPEAEEFQNRARKPKLTKVKMEKSSEGESGPEKDNERTLPLIECEPLNDLVAGAYKG